MNDTGVVRKVLSAFGVPELHIAPYGEINHGPANLSYISDVKSGDWEIPMRLKARSQQGLL